jgi:hypothetical protein
MSRLQIIILTAASPGVQVAGVQLQRWHGGLDRGRWRRRLKGYNISGLYFTRLWFKASHFPSTYVRIKFYFCQVIT